MLSVAAPLGVQDVGGPAPAVTTDVSDTACMDDCGISASAAVRVVADHVAQARKGRGSVTTQPDRDVLAAELMGHRTPAYQPGAAAITLARYTHTLPAELERAGDVLDAFIAERAREDTAES